MPRYKLTIAYDGTHFHGWQKQHPPGEEPLRTVQGVMDVEVDMTYDPPWTPERMSEEAQVALGWY